MSWLGAVQAQDYPGAQWALGLRLRQATDATIERAFTDGAILRTHVMRPTWHFVTPADIRWLQQLTAPRVNAANAYMYRRCELDEALLARGNEVIAAALQGGRHLTRAELGAALAAAGIAADGIRLGYIIMRAELDAVVCSGPRRGKQFTYALLAERAPQTRTLPREEALAELTRRYYTGHGPATVRDFCWWAGLSAADAKAGLALAGSHLCHETIDGQAYWFATSPMPVAPSLPVAAPPPTASPMPAVLPPVAAPDRDAFLLPTYDEFLVGYSSFAASRAGGPDSCANLVFDATIVLGGQIAGTWRRTLQKGAVEIELAPFVPLGAADAEAVAAAARRYGAFLGLPVRTTTRT